MHQARGAGKRKSPKRSSLLTFVLIGARGHGGFLELACAHLNHAACNLHGLVAKPRLRQAQPSRITKQHRFTDLRRGSLVATVIAMVLQVPLHGKKRPDRAKHVLSRPLLCRPKGVSVCSVVKKVPLPSGLHVGETARKPTSKPLSVPPCLRLLRVNRPEANRTPRAEGGAGTSRAKHTLPTRSYAQTHFISAEQRLHTAAICNHTT